MTAKVTGEPVSVDPLVVRAVAGDRAAFGELYALHHDGVFRFVYRRVGGRKQLAEDLTADTFVRALASIGSFRWQGRPFSAWLVTIARNRVADHFKSARHRLEASVADPATFDVDDVVDVGSRWHPSAEHEVVDRDTAAQLWGAVDRLMPDQARTVRLRYLCDRSVPETAALMDRQEGAVKALTYRAVQNLRRCETLR